MTPKYAHMVLDEINEQAESNFKCDVKNKVEAIIKTNKMISDLQKQLAKQKEELKALSFETVNASVLD